MISCNRKSNSSCPSWIKTFVIALTLFTITNGIVILIFWESIKRLP